MWINLGKVVKLFFFLRPTMLESYFVICESTLLKLDLTLAKLIQLQESYFLNLNYNCSALLKVELGLTGN